MTSKPRLREGYRVIDPPKPKTDKKEDEDNVDGAVASTSTQNLNKSTDGAMISEAQKFDDILSSNLNLADCSVVPLY